MEIKVMQNIAQSKAKGKDYFVNGLNAAGKTWVETEEGQDFLARHFPDAKPA